MRRFRSSAGVAALLAIAVAWPPLARAAEPPRVGVLSMLPEKLYLSFVGVLVFGNAGYTREVEGWDLNDRVLGHLLPALEAGGVEVVQPDYPRESMMAELGYNNLKFVRNVVREQLDAVVAENALDWLLVVFPAHQGSKCPSGEPCVGYGSTGYGVINRNQKRAQVYISIEAYLLDPTSMKIAGGWKRNEDVELSSTTWYAEGEDWPQEVLAQIERDVHALIDEHVGEATTRFIGSKRAKKRLGLP